MREAIITSLLMLFSILGMIGCYALQCAKAELQKKGQWKPKEDPEYRNHIGL